MCKRGGAVLSRLEGSMKGAMCRVDRKTATEGTASVNVATKTGKTGDFLAALTGKLPRSPLRLSTRPGCAAGARAKKRSPAQARGRHRLI